MQIPFWPKKSNKPLLDESISQLQALRINNDILAICAKPTGYSWLGVNVATKSLFPGNTFEMPQYYSNSIFNTKELQVLSNTINQLDFKQVIWSGFAPFYEILCLQLNPRIIQRTIYHGFLAEFAENPLQRSIFNTLIRLAQSQKIKNIGFVKKGFGLSVAQKYGIATNEIILPNLNVLKETKTPEDDIIRIGCLVNGSFRKNLHNMAFAASMVPGAEIHVFNTKELDYLIGSNIVYHGLMPHNDFLNLLGSMTINLHVTFSEGMGGQVCAESISQGVPCISAYNSSFFDYNEDLKAKLVVDGFDDSWYIYQKMVEVLTDYESLAKKCVNYAYHINELANNRIEIFLNT